MFQSLIQAPEYRMALSIMSEAKKCNFRSACEMTSLQPTVSKTAFGQRTNSKIGNGGSSHFLHDLYRGWQEHGSTPRPELRESNYYGLDSWQPGGPTSHVCFCKTPHSNLICEQTVSKLQGPGSEDIPGALFRRMDLTETRCHCHQELVSQENKQQIQLRLEI